MSNVKKLKIISPIAMILLVLTVSGVLLALSGAGRTFAFVVEGNDCGLEVRVAEEFTDVSNLNPGDTKDSYLTVSNAGSGTFKYFFDIRKIRSTAGGYRGQDGKPLDEILQMKVKRGDETLFEGLVSDFTEKDMGDLAAGGEQQLGISVYFPEEAGNEYQGADVTVQFKFRAICDLEEQGSPPSTSPSPPSSPRPPEGSIVPPESPEGPPEDGELIEEEFPPEEPEGPPGDGELIEEKIPPEPPKTGEFPPAIIYGAGLLLVLAGLLLRKKAQGAFRNNKGR